jgi:hypothetical protein
MCICEARKMTRSVNIRVNMQRNYAWHKIFRFFSRIQISHVDLTMMQYQYWLQFKHRSYLVVFIVHCLFNKIIDYMLLPISSLCLFLSSESVLIEGIYYLFRYNFIKFTHARINYTHTHTYMHIYTYVYVNINVLIQHVVISKGISDDMLPCYTVHI